MHVSRLYVNALRHPLGLDHPKPSLGWSLAGSNERAQSQSAYRIIVTLSPDSVGQETSVVWDSGIVSSRRQFGIVYAGVPLRSRQRYQWKVQVWDNQGRMTESEPDWWEMGLLQPEDWSAKWIESAAGETEDNRLAMPMIRHEFATSPNVTRARAYISGLGQYELRLNGSKVGDDVLEPGWTHYDRTCLYKVYDITALLSEKRQAIGVLLGNGFYHVESGGRYAKYERSFGRPKCIVQVEIDYADGSRDIIGSDAGWQASAGPITFSAVYGGEDYDARLAQTGWDEPKDSAVSAGHWTGAVESTAPLGALKWDNSIPLKAMRKYEPVQVTRLAPDRYVFDFGVNFSGWVGLALRGKSGARVKLTPAELLNEDGTVNQKWTGTPCEWHYTTSGEGTEQWQPRFSYSGFRYVQVDGAYWTDQSDAADAAMDSAIPALLKLEGLMIYPEIEAAGSFECSEDLLNRTHQIINQAILSNTKSVFTDCPHREKFGWLEQVHLMGPALAYNYSLEPLLCKVMDDIRDAQLESGMVPTTAPEFVVFQPPWDMFRHSVPWGAAYILNGWLLYTRYGNSQVLSDHYEGMKKYVEYLVGHADGFIIKDGLGDWYDVGEEGPGFCQNTPIALPETAMFYHIVDVLRQIAELLEQREDATRLASLGSQIKTAYREAFYDPETKRYTTGSQAAHAMSLALGLTDDDDRDAVLRHLVDDIVARGYHTNAGDVAYRYVLLALSRNDRNDLIARMASKTDHPSYGYQIVNGATSLTEAWDGPTVGKSQNHFMLGHIEEWFYRDLAGIDYAFDSSAEAFHYVVKPYLGESYGYANAAVRKDLGELKLSWERDARGEVRLDITVPVNGTATLCVPAPSPEALTESGQSVAAAQGVAFERYEDGCAVLALGSGTYQFAIGLAD